MTTTPGRPATEAQRARYRRILDVATMLVTNGGEDALQMSDLPALADVSLATLYRYFPSKQHLVFAIIEEHLESVLARTHPRGSAASSSVRERAAEHLLRGFHVDQKLPQFGAVVRHLTSMADPYLAAQRERIGRLHYEIVLRSVGPMSPQQREIINVIIVAADAAVRHWMAGIMTADEVRFQILSVCRMLDLPAEQVTADRELAREGRA
jgi:TetR/AcrR family transcriptional regulator, cholesterol catabolism regulator